MAFKKSKMPSEIRKMLYFLCGMYMFDAAAWQKVAASVGKIFGRLFDNSRHEYSLKGVKTLGALEHNDGQIVIIFGDEQKLIFPVR